MVSQLIDPLLFYCFIYLSAYLLLKPCIRRPSSVDVIHMRIQGRVQTLIPTNKTDAPMCLCMPSGDDKSSGVRRITPFDMFKGAWKRCPVINYFGVGILVPMSYLKLSGHTYVYEHETDLSNI